MKEAISLQELFKILWKKLFLILAVSIVTVTIAGVVSYFFITPTYKASTQILITQKNELNQFNMQDIQTNLQLINTYNVIIKSPAILSKVIENLELNTTPDKLNKIITVNSEQNSQVVTVSVHNPSHMNAVKIANMTAEVFQHEIKYLMNVDNVNILSPAFDTNNPIPEKPKPILIMAISIVIGLMIGMGIAVLIEVLDTTVKSDQDIEELLQLPNLGLISIVSKKDLLKNKEVISRRRRRRLKVV